MNTNEFKDLSDIETEIGKLEIGLIKNQAERLYELYISGKHEDKVFFSENHKAKVFKNLYIDKTKERMYIELEEHELISVPKDIHLSTFMDKAASFSLRSDITEQLNKALEGDFKTRPRILKYIYNKSLPNLLELISGFVLWFVSLTLIKPSSVWNTGSFLKKGIYYTGHVKKQQFDVDLVDDIILEFREQNRLVLGLRDVDKENVENEYKSVTE